uniref:Uncharacterized protein n=1 Tax=Glossina palpalis gambiensis TaxID=67801 RepID=A0A1B0C295_9MUSC
GQLKSTEIEVPIDQLPPLRSKETSNCSLECFRVENNVRYAITIPFILFDILCNQLFVDGILGSTENKLDFRQFLFSQPRYVTAFCTCSLKELSKLLHALMLLPGWLSTVIIAVYEDVDDLILMKIS